MTKEQTTIRQFTLRITEDMYQDAKKEADEIGSSLNSYILLMIRLGIKAYRGKLIIHLEE